MKRGCASGNTSIKTRFIQALFRASSLIKLIFKTLAAAVTVASFFAYKLLHGVEAHPVGEPTLLFVHVNGTELLVEA